ncbi:MAG: inositol monophosphatase [Chloroflexi bacterium CG07_land_8_20_14_0_80_51_10]|nr:MAG: inositol monophosphatase [Chloroflexi bacterium CG07_land_8_20_14_0_80_51_10]
MKDTAPDLSLSQSGKEPLVIASQAIREAGAILKSHFWQEKKIQSKGRRNLVTDIDLLTEQHILSLLNDEYPNHSTLGEESGKTEGTSDYCWVIDPLDGTTNYVYGIPIFAVSLGLTYKDEVVLGMVYDPLRDELFWAQKGREAFLNDSPISVAGERNLQTTIIGLDLGYDDTKTRDMLLRVNGFWSGEKGLRLIGSAALGLAYVACGRLDIYLHPRIYPWDIAAGILLIREAGGEVTDWQGKPATIWSDKIFACGDISEHQTVRAVLRDCCLRS